MYLKIVLGVVFFVILISIQYSLNRILYELREIKKNLYKRKDYD
ncbi:hypothetical protein [Sporanaerobacter sp.]